MLPGPVSLFIIIVPAAALRNTCGRRKREKLMMSSPMVVI
jgi:hypothetical protein